MSSPGVRRYFSTKKKKTTNQQQQQKQNNKNPKKLPQTPQKFPKTLRLLLEAYILFNALSAQDIPSGDFDKEGSRCVQPGSDCHCCAQAAHEGFAPTWWDLSRTQGLAAAYTWLAQQGQGTLKELSFTRNSYFRMEIEK